MEKHLEAREIVDKQQKVRHNEGWKDMQKLGRMNDNR